LVDFRACRFLHRKKEPACTLPRDAIHSFVWLSNHCECHSRPALVFWVARRSHMACSCDWMDNHTSQCLPGSLLQIADRWRLCRKIYQPVDKKSQCTASLYKT